MTRISTPSLITQLRRVATFLNNDAAHTRDARERDAMLGRSNTCFIAAFRLEELHELREATVRTRKVKR